MRVEFAYAGSVAATVARLTASSNRAASVETGYATPLMGRIADPDNDNGSGAQLAAEEITTLELVKTAPAGGAQIAAREATNPRAADFRAFLTRIKCIRPDVSVSGGSNTTGGRLTVQAAEPGIRAKILGGDGVWTDKVGELADSAAQNPVNPEAAVAPSNLTKGADFLKKDEGRFHTPVQSDAPFAYDAVYVIVDAMKRAHSIDAPKVLAAMPSTGCYRVTGGVTSGFAFDDKGDLKEGAITLYDFKDSEAAVLDAVEM
jgi:branched-chain amino acid transport system substrate-binding protein